MAPSYEDVRLPVSGRTASSARSAATLAGKGTGYGVEENVWTRQRTSEGWIYYFNPATGNSQWHLPNELYESARTVRGKWKKKGQAITFPGEAKATMGVDCITEGINSEDVVAMPKRESGPCFAVSDADPRDMERLMNHLPSNLVNTLKSAEFEAACRANFAEVTGDPHSLLSIEDASLLVGAVATSVRSEPALRLNVEKSRFLTTKFRTSLEVEDIDWHEFVLYARWILAAQYLEGSTGF